MLHRHPALETVARCGLPLAMLAVLVLVPVIGGYGVLVCAVVLWKASGVWL